MGTREQNACYPICGAVFMWSFLVVYLIRPLPFIPNIKDQNIRLYVYCALAVFEFLVIFKLLQYRYVRNQMHLELYEQYKGMSKKKRVISIVCIFIFCFIPLITLSIIIFYKK